MAYAWRISQSTIGFNLDECEEGLLVAAYVATRGIIGQESWLRDFEKWFFEDDKGVSDFYLGRINAALRASENIKLLLKFKPTDKSSYMQVRGLKKIESRKELLRILTSPNGEAGRKLAEARSAVTFLPPPQGYETAAQDEFFAEASSRLTGEARKLFRVETAPFRPVLTPGESILRKHALESESAPPVLAPGVPVPAGAAPVPSADVPAPQLPPAADPGVPETFLLALLQAVTRIADGQADLLVAVRELISRLPDTRSADIAPAAVAEEPIVDIAAVIPQAEIHVAPLTLPLAANGPVLLRKEGRMKLGGLPELATAIGPEDFTEGEDPIRRASPKTRKAAPGIAVVTREIRVSAKATKPKPPKAIVAPRKTKAAVRVGVGD